MTNNNLFLCLSLLGDSMLYFAHDAKDSVYIADICISNFKLLFASFELYVSYVLYIHMYVCWSVSISISHCVCFRRYENTMFRINVFNSGVFFSLFHKNTHTDSLLAFANSKNLSSTKNLSCQILHGMNEGNGEFYSSFTFSHQLRTQNTQAPKLF